MSEELSPVADLKYLPMFFKRPALLFNEFIFATSMHDQKSIGDEIQKS